MPVNIQKRLLIWAAGFLFLHSLILMLSPAVRERSWDVDYRLSHWVAYFSWLTLAGLAHLAVIRFLPDADPYIFPAAALLSGWGLLTIWRLDESFGIRQLTSFSISIAIFSVIAMRVPHNLAFLRRYKYVLLSGGLLLTSLTLIAGTNPLGVGPRLWLGCCGVYFQPSEPLKLLLVIYLAAYLADRHPLRLTAIPLLLPTTLLTGLALTLLFVQRDLGTASIFIFIFTIFLFLVTGRRRVLLVAVVLLILSLLIGYFFIEIIRVRVDTWLNPWADPSGRSYQIVQSLLAIANGGIAGRGPGLGNPLLVPVAFSDFIFAAIAEETGLVGTIGLFGILWLILARGMIIALHAPDRFRRFLASGIVTYLGVQSLLIIAGNLRLSPLTGVTLPFISHGGSSLLTSFVAAVLLLIISHPKDQEPVVLNDPQPYSILSGLLGLGLVDDHSRSRPAQPYRQCKTRHC
jgi:cell division protein FtsW (lipid II flippase)